MIPRKPFTPAAGHAACWQCPLWKTPDEDDFGQCVLLRHRFHAESPACGTMRASIEINAERSQKADMYDFIRTLNVPEFADLFARNIRGEGRFDDMVSVAMIERAKRHNDKPSGRAQKGNE